MANLRLPPKVACRPAGRKGSEARQCFSAKNSHTRQIGGRGAIDAYVKDKIPMGRWASVAESAESILYLASDRSSYMTGHAPVIDGGESIA
ncbi:MAG TPA: SDR family oxidoreductase [Dongiaceae bacterium]|nr:SDR family oxidoreductase [Dongiaceae bacterium]